MVEINNHRSSSICRRGRRELITDVRKPVKRVMTSGGELFTDYLITLANLSAKLQNSNQQAPDATSFFPVGGCHCKQFTWKTSPKVRTLWHCSRLRSVALYRWLIVVDICQAPDRCSNIWASLPGAGYGRSSIRLTAWLQNSKKRAERSERLMYEQSHRDYLRSGYLHHRLPVSIANHYRDNAITYKAQRDKNARTGSWRTRQLLTCRCVSVMLLRSMQNTRRS